MGRADSSLVAASFKEAMAGVPADLKDVYDKNEEAFKTFSDEKNIFKKPLKNGGSLWLQKNKKVQTDCT